MLTYLNKNNISNARVSLKITLRNCTKILSLLQVEVTHGEEKQIIALPAERLDRSKKYYVTFTVRGEAQQEIDKPKSSIGIQRNAKSV